MAATISTLNAILKEFYLAPIQEQLNQEVLVLELMEKAVVDWAGRRVVIPLHTARNSGVGFRADGAALPTAGQEGYSRAEVEAKFLYGRFEITGPAISSLAKGGTASFAGYVQAEMDKLVEDVRNQSNRAAFCGGSTVGVLNQRKVEAGPATWQFTGDVAKVNSLLAAAILVGGAGSELSTTIHTSFPGGFGTATGGYETIKTDVRVSAVDVPNSNLTLSALDTTQTVSAISIPQGFGAVVTVTGAVDGKGAPIVVPAITALGNEPVGIYGNLGSQIHFTVNRQFVAPATDNTPILRSTIITQNQAGNQDRASLSLARIQDVFDRVMEVSGVEPNYIIMHPTQRQRYVSLLQGQVQGAGLMSDAGKGSKIADGGYVGLSYGNVPIKVSKDAPKGGLEFMKLDTWKLCELEKGDFADLDGAVISRVPNLDSYEGYYRHYYNTVSVRPNANGILVGCTL